MVDMKKYDELYSKIMRRLNSSKVKNTNEVVSMYDVACAVNEAMSLYNILLVKSQDRIIKKLNKSLGYGLLTPSFVKKSLPRVSKIANTIDENGDAFVCIYFEDGNSIFVTGNSEFATIFNTTFTGSEVLDFVKFNKETFNIYLGCLKEFASNYPGVKVNFGPWCKNSIDQKLDDGFMACTVGVVNPEDTQIGFASMYDHSLATDRTKKYAELYDYVAFYNEELLKKSAVNVNDLNPFVRACVSQYLNIEDNSLTLSK